MSLPRAAILIGGRSTRMGRDKALVPRNGVAQVFWLHRLLTPFSRRPPLWVGTPSSELRDHPDVAALTEVPWVADCNGGDGARQGPLAGLVGLLDHAGDDEFLVVAVDLFGLTSTALDWLLAQRETCRERGGVAFWPRLPGRPFGEPLCAWYQRDGLLMMAESFARGERALHRALPAASRCEVAVPPALQPMFANINEAEALAAFVRES